MATTAGSAGPASVAERRGSLTGANPQHVTDEVNTFCGTAPSNFTGQGEWKVQSTCSMLDHGMENCWLENVVLQRGLHLQ